jgi:hypothetical protein
MELPMHAISSTTPEAVEQIVSFQIADGNKRQDCVLKTKFPTQLQANKYLMINWPTIERLARDAMTTGKIKHGQVRLVVL